MKAHLMFHDRDFDPKAALPPNAKALEQDLELGVLLKVMAREDEFLLGIARTALLTSETDLETILYRQDALRDCLAHAETVRGLYDTAVEAVGYQRRHWRSTYDYPGGRLSRAVELVQALTTFLQQLRGVADADGQRFNSEAFRAFFEMIRRELDDSFFQSVNEHLERLRFRDGTYISSHLGRGNRGEPLILRKAPSPRPSLWQRILSEPPSTWFEDVWAEKPASYIFRLHPRDEAGARALSEIRDRGINLVANALDESVAHILSFFGMLRNELGFYVSCLNLADDLRAKKANFAFPEPAPLGQRRFSTKGLYDVTLAISMGRNIVGNDIVGNCKSLFVVTGANQGGKSTFLRSVGVAQMMMQCGLFVGASTFAADVVDGVFTHYKREEDSSMTSGKLDEELARMSEIANWIHANSLLLSNESFAATNEREGSEIARQIVNALLTHRVKIVLVTHLYDLAHGFRASHTDEMLFLRAEREESGERTFRLVEGDPLETSYGEDLYRQIFEERTAQETPLAAQ